MQTAGAEPQKAHLVIVCHGRWLKQRCSRWWPKDLHTHTFNGPLSGTTQVSWYQKGETNLDFSEARDSEWQWHQLGRMQVCTSLQTDNQTSTPPLSVFTGRMPFLPPNQQCQSTEGTMRQQMMKFWYGSGIGQTIMQTICTSLQTNKQVQKKDTENRDGTWRIGNKLHIVPYRVTSYTRKCKRYNQSGFYWSKRQWVAVASAGLCASLHLAPDR